VLYKGQKTFLESFFLVVFKIFGPKNLDLDPYQDSVPTYGYGSETQRS